MLCWFHPIAICLLYRPRGFRVFGQPQSDEPPYCLPSPVTPPGRVCHCTAPHPPLPISFRNSLSVVGTCDAFLRGPWALHDPKNAPFFVFGALYPPKHRDGASLKTSSSHPEGIKPSAASRSRPMVSGMAALVANPAHGGTQRDCGGNKMTKESAETSLYTPGKPNRVWLRGRTTMCEDHDLWRCGVCGEIREGDWELKPVIDSDGWRHIVCAECRADCPELVEAEDGEMRLPGCGRWRPSLPPEPVAHIRLINPRRSVSGGE